MIMKKINSIAVILIAFSSACLAQENNKEKFFSSEIFFTSPYYLTEYKNQINYGLGILISENIKPIKISTGLFYNTKKYFSSYENISAIDKVTYSLQYYNIPFLVGINLLRKENIKNQFLISTGVIFNIPRNYSSITYYKNNSLPTTNDTPVDYKSGSSFRLGFQFHKGLNSIFNLYAGAFIDYKFQLDRLVFNDSTPHWHRLYSKDRFSIGLNIGLEWRYQKE